MSDEILNRLVTVWFVMKQVIIIIIILLDLLTRFRLERLNSGKLVFLHISGKSLQ